MNETKGTRILVVEDEPDLCEVIRYNLQGEGFELIGTGDGEEGWRLVREQHPQLVLLDLMLPGMDGLEICRRMKEDEATRGIAVIMVTARGEESDIVLGLELGADDYVTKPFSPRELVARVKAVLRRDRREGEAATGRLVADPIVIDRDRHEVKVDDRRIDLTPTEFRLLEALATSPGRVFTREQLIRQAIGEGVVVTERNVDVHIKSLRKKLGDARGLIETIRGVGYRFLEDGGKA